MRKFGLVGKSLGHSWSKEYFTRKLITTGLDDCSYENFQLDDIIVLKELILSDPGLLGLNITIPFKEHVLSLLDETDPVAQAIGAVNCIKVSRTGNLVKLKGFNTDMPAFQQAVKPLLHGGIKKALVLGTGGAARAVCYALKELRIEPVQVSRFKKPGVFVYEEIGHKIINEYKLIINATPVGMFPETSASPLLPYDLITPDHILFDLIYNPEKTKFLEYGEKAGSVISNGLEMLYLQAELSWKLWEF